VKNAHLPPGHEPGLQSRRAARSHHLLGCDVLGSDEHATQPITPVAHTFPSLIKYEMC
jgi:hypothetical protein